MHTATKLHKQTTCNTNARMRVPTPARPPTKPNQKCSKVIIAPFLAVPVVEGPSICIWSSAICELLVGKRNKQKLIAEVLSKCNCYKTQVCLLGKVGMVEAQVWTRTKTKQTWPHFFGKGSTKSLGHSEELSPQLSEIRWAISFTLASHFAAHQACAHPSSFSNFHQFARS